ncbi:bifunctional hydroxymethylpyrimidine kinase/phosphomethylpyrimidine kinase [Salisaeta longa]|uniref:bifunctional hydroxymethylpyrimidine kinase/phosphomethylpyrimidine kinase n=1 Tax=Salisaeta longa TaxID=503170 RepID=UPI0003B5BCE9|nr:bifunctional hydroxymethylpyrimidine kinase/phosphomethylpyrimidine kinase [Salisaeta longa]
MFYPLLVNAHYPTLSRGLMADRLAVQALGGDAATVCTSHIVASDGVVTDVLHVPSDTVHAQIEHAFQVRTPTAAKVGILGDAHAVEAVFEMLEAHLAGPLVFDVTLSGPSGEDIIDQRGIDAIGAHIGAADVVSIGRTDAELLAGMKIPSLDDAQVAAQRIAKEGAPRVLLRCGKLPTHYFEDDGDAPNYAVDLFYDGDEFAVFEAPYLDGIDTLHGAASGLLASLLSHYVADGDWLEALQKAKGQITEALRAAQQCDNDQRMHYLFSALQQHAAPAVNP